ncbi:MAG: hypothetical protein MJB14_06750 [Spirochaetes bacterium]|nr:hypothetical protein [Spirochaetota bacterium]
MNQNGISQLNWNSLRQKLNWIKWLEKQKKDNPALHDYWAVHSCNGCQQLDDTLCWCNLLKLPATYNQDLTESFGITGMPCGGEKFERLAKLTHDSEILNLKIQK